jgi:hypothetical protein
VFTRKAHAAQVAVSPEHVRLASSFAEGLADVVADVSKRATAVTGELPSSQRVPTAPVRSCACISARTVMVSFMNHTTCLASALHERMCNSCGADLLACM